MAITPRFEHVVGDMAALFVAATEEPERVGLVLVPAARREAVVPGREYLDSPWVRALPASFQPVRAREVAPLVQVHRRGDAGGGGFAFGRTLQGGATTGGLRLAGQSTAAGNSHGLVVTTRLRDEGGLVVEHQLIHLARDECIEIRTRVINEGRDPVTLELLSSFCLGGITPFAAADEPGRLRVHRFRSAWSAEGRLETRPLEELHLERSWLGHGVRVERFGQAGSLPVNGFFPQMAIEDVVAGVTWAVVLACPGSWQLELYRRGDTLAASGGQADREVGQWWKTLRPGEDFAGPPALLTVVAGGLEEACDRLLAGRRRRSGPAPAAEHDLPVVFNEWCTSWGNPSHAGVVALADELDDLAPRYLVIDDGWAARPGPGFQQNGDWLVSREAFPDGLRAAAEAVRGRGIIPGLWFEYEVVNPGAKAWGEARHQLHRDGRPLQVGSRRFWDFRDPWVGDYLAERVIGLLRNNGIGYLKIDYNDTTGPACDGAESPGEGLRQHLEGVQRFLARLRRELPELVIENCSSGGHRLESSFVALTAMSSISDAHETPDIPVIAANLHRLVPPEQSQVWCVVRAGDSLARLGYSLAAAFLGRLCLSGEITGLTEPQRTFLRRGLACYREYSPLLRTARFRTFGRRSDSYQHPAGWQAVLADPGTGGLYVIWHAFAEPPGEGEVVLPAGPAWRVQDQFAAEPGAPAVEGRMLRWHLPAAFTAGVIRLTS